jgi:hypothetical protein
MNPDIPQIVTKLRADVDKLLKNPPLATHSHTGFDMDKVLFSNIAGRTQTVCHTIYGTGAATGTNYGVFFVARQACYLSYFQEVHQTAGSDGSAVTVTPEKLTGTTALDSGVEMLATALSLKATANTVQTGTLTATLANRNLAAGDRVALKDAGTLTAVANVTVLLEVTFI